MRQTLRLLVLVSGMVWAGAMLPAQTVTPQAPAQPLPLAPAISQSVLVLSQERLLRDSKKGQLLLQQEEQIKAERDEAGRALETELEAEERDLAARKPEIDPKEFEGLAAAFDARVVEIRQADARSAEELAVEFEAKRKAFFAEVVPIVAAIMEERSALLVFEQRTVLFTGANVDITNDVIARMDKAAGLE